MDNHPTGWPLLYETPLGMICLYGKVMVCTSLGSLLRPLFYFLCSNLKVNPVDIKKALPKVRADFTNILQKLFVQRQN